MIRLLTWNLGAKALRNAESIKKEIERYQPHIVALQEVPEGPAVRKKQGFVEVLRMDPSYSEMATVASLDLQHQAERILQDRPGLLRTLSSDQVVTYLRYRMHRQILIAVRPPVEFVHEDGAVDMHSLVVTLRYADCTFRVIASHIYHGCGSEDGNFAKLTMIRRVRDDILAAVGPPAVWCGDFNAALSPCSRVRLVQRTADNEGELWLPVGDPIESSKGQACRYSGDDLIRTIFSRGYPMPFRDPAAEGVKYHYTHTQRQGSTLFRYPFDYIFADARLRPSLQRVLYEVERHHLSDHIPVFAELFSDTPEGNLPPLPEARG